MAREMIIRRLAMDAFSFGREVGVDLEAVRAMPDGDDIAAGFFCRENETYLALDVRDRPVGFFNCWTRKEAFINAVGDGLLTRWVASMFRSRRRSRPGSCASRTLKVQPAAGRFTTSILNLD